MTRSLWTRVMLAVAALALSSVALGLALACGGDGEGNLGEQGGGEESAKQLAKTETFDAVRAGARLIARYDADSGTFTGTVENTTSATLVQVRVEIHLSNGEELGPTAPVDLAPGEVAPVTLTPSAPFETWSAHAEVGTSAGSGEHEGGSESGGGDGG